MKIIGLIPYQLFRYLVIRHRLGLPALKSYSPLGRPRIGR